MKLLTCAHKKQNNALTHTKNTKRKCATKKLLAAICSCTFVAQAYAVIPQITLVPFRDSTIILVPIRQLSVDNAPAYAAFYDRRLQAKDVLLASIKQCIRLDNNPSIIINETAFNTQSVVRQTKHPVSYLYEYIKREIHHLNHPGTWFATTQETFSCITPLFDEFFSALAEVAARSLKNQRRDMTVEKLVATFDSNNRIKNQFFSQTTVIQELQEKLHRTLPETVRWKDYIRAMQEQASLLFQQAAASSDPALQNLLTSLVRPKFNQHRNQLCIFFKRYPENPPLTTLLEELIHQRACRSLYQDFYLHHRGMINALTFLKVFTQIVHDTRHHRFIFVITSEDQYSNMKKVLVQIIGKDALKNVCTFGDNEGIQADELQTFFNLFMPYHKTIIRYKPIRYCASCGLPLAHVRVCASCRTNAYCDRSCQRADWPEHKQHCPELTELHMEKRAQRSEELERLRRNALLKKLKYMRPTIQEQEKYDMAHPKAHQTKTPTPSKAPQLPQTAPSASSQEQETLDEAMALINAAGLASGSFYRVVYDAQGNPVGFDDNPYTGNGESAGAGPAAADVANAGTGSETASSHSPKDEKPTKKEKGPAKY